MTFNLIRLSQQDPRWKNTPLGLSSDSTIGAYGCALTSVSMLLSGFGFPETPASLNAKLKQRGGFVQDAIVWGAVNSLYPQVRYKNLVLCRDTNAPIDAIGNAIAAGQPVLLEVDSSPKTGLQTHWVVAYQKVGKDFTILDPWPYPTEDGKDVSLMTRYGQGKELKRAISAAIFYECIQAAATPTDGLYVRVKSDVPAGLRIRSAGTVNANTLAIEYPGALLKVIEDPATGKPKIGIYDQWLRVRTAAGVEGYTAAWFVESAGDVSPAPAPTPAPGEEPAPQPEPAAPPPVPPVNEPPAAIQRVRPSVADGLETVNLEAPADQHLSASASQSGTHHLVADIWNRYGGLLGALSAKLGIEPGTAAAALAVESGGQAFGPYSRLLLRFENHIFYTYWGKQHPDQFKQFFTFNASQSWTGHQWRPDTHTAWADFHGDQSKEWMVFNFACQLDDTAAKQSISMGAAQIMGFNFPVLGYASVQDMFNAFSRSERDQVIGFFDFVQGVLPGGGAVTHLKRKDFTSFATIYNGSGQASYYSGLIKNCYQAFNSLSPAQTTTPPETETIFVLVSKSVGSSGMRMRRQPSLAGALVTVEPAGASLRLLDANEKAKIGKQGAWLHVRDRKNLEGYVAAWLVELDTKNSTLNAPASFAVADFSEPQPFTVYVSSLAKGGLRLRKAPGSRTPILTTLLAGAPLEVQEDLLTAQMKLGRYGEWLKVKEPLGTEGYAAAWLLEA